MEHRRREPAPGIFRLVLPLPFPGLTRVNAYLIRDGDGCTLVDCGIHDPGLEDGGFPELVDALKACDVSVSDVTRLVVTHPHIDHYGMAGRLIEEAGCELWMHETSTEDLEAYEDPSGVAERLRRMLEDHGIPPEEVEDLAAFEDWRPFVSDVVEATARLKGGETFKAGGRTWSIVYTPGHAKSHLCVWDARDHVLISGDHLLPTITPHIDFKRGDSDPLGDFLASLDKVVDLDPALVLPGHGRPFEDGGERARVIIRHHDRRLGSILQVIRREAHTADEITDEIFGDELLNFERRLALGEALAHLAHLRNAKEIERVERPDGTFAYRKAARRRVAEEDE
ncbi:MAG: MBL fold metallo-hydrolase [Actinomycetota bacterium]